MDKEQLYRLHMHWIEECEKSDKLSEWEENFVQSVKGSLERWGSLSPKQTEILDRIYSEKTD